MTMECTTYLNIHDFEHYAGKTSWDVHFFVTSREDYREISIRCNSNLV